MNTQDEQTKPSAQRNRHWLRRTHRYIGFAAFLFLILISATGLVLNHAEALGLTHGSVGGSLLPRLYGISPPEVNSAFEASGIVFATAAATLYADANPVAEGVPGLVGVVATRGGIVACSGSEFLLFSEHGMLIERLDVESARSIEKLGFDGETVVASAGGALLEFDPQRMAVSAIEPGNDSNVRWATAIQPDARMQRRIGAAALGDSLSWARVLTDIHSGRILPFLGRWLADLTALCVLYLSISGLFLWYQRR